MQPAALGLVMRLKRAVAKALKEVNLELSDPIVAALFAGAAPVDDTPAAAEAAKKARYGMLMTAMKDKDLNFLRISGYPSSPPRRSTASSRSASGSATSAGQR